MPKMRLGLAQMTVNATHLQILVRAVWQTVTTACLVVVLSTSAFAARVSDDVSVAPPPPKSATRPALAVSPASAEVVRLARINSARSWGYQLEGIKFDDVQRSPYDLLVVDATTGLAAQRPFRRDEVQALRTNLMDRRAWCSRTCRSAKPKTIDLNILRPEYMEEDAPDWLMHENKDWKGNRIINFCSDGWQKTIFGDEQGNSLYSSDQLSPLYKLIDLGFDGVYLDRVDVYEEVGKQCPNAEERMVDFVVKLAAHARKRNPYFMVVLQNAEDLLKHPRMVKALDAVAKESLFHGWGGGDGSNSKATSSAADITWSTTRLNIAKKAGRPVFVVDYCADRTRADLSVKSIRAQGYVPYIAKKSLNTLYLPGRDFKIKSVSPHGN